MTPQPAPVSRLPSMLYSPFRLLLFPQGKQKFGFYLASLHSSTASQARDVQPAAQSSGHLSVFLLLSRSGFRGQAPSPFPGPAPLAHAAPASYTLKLEPVRPPADSLPCLPSHKGVHHRQLPRARQGSPRLLRSPGRRDQPTPTSRPLLEAPKLPRTQQAQGRARVSVQRSCDLKLKAQSSVSAPPPTAPPTPEQGRCVLPCLPPVPSSRP